MSILSPFDTFVLHFYDGRLLRRCQRGRYSYVHYRGTIHIRFVDEKMALDRCACSTLFCHLISLRTHIDIYNTPRSVMSSLYG